jgi:FixJ family two-component response regulator
LHDEHARSEVRARWSSLTAGERDVFALVVQGLLNKQIAAELDVKEITVKVRRAHVMQKMQAGSLADLVRMSALIEP